MRPWQESNQCLHLLAHPACSFPHLVFLFTSTPPVTYATCPMLHVEAPVPTKVRLAVMPQISWKSASRSPADVKLFPSFTLASPNATQNNVQDGWMSRRSPGLSFKDNSEQRGLAPISNFLCISAIKLRMFRGRRSLPGFDFPPRNSWNPRRRHRIRVCG